MGNPYKKVRPGQPLDIPAEAFNTLLDMAAEWKGRRQNTAVPAGRPGGDSMSVRIRNESGLDLGRFAPIGIGGPIVGPADNLEGFLSSPIALKGIPAMPGRPFAITQEPLPTGKIGLCLIGGITVCRITVFDPDPEAQWAEPAQGNPPYLRTYRGGSLRILWKDPAANPTWAIAAFHANPHPLVRLRLVQTLGKDSGAVVSARLLGRGNGQYAVPDYNAEIPVADLSGLGFSAPANTIATAELHFGVPVNGTIYDVFGILTDIRC